MFITEDILVEILVRVPARPLVRFKCVSKHWLSLISDTKFCHRHTLQNPHSSISAVFPRTLGRGILPIIPLIDLDHDFRSSNHRNQNVSGSVHCNSLYKAQNHHVFMIIQSCNGLFLCCHLGYKNKPPYYVLNPTTNQCITLIPPSAGQTHWFLGQALVFDPSKSPHYKVLHLYKDFHPDYQIEIYSSEAKSWRLVDSSFRMVHFIRYEVGVYWNGAVHWVGIFNKQVLYYLIDDERFERVLDPDRDVSSSLRAPLELSEFRFLQESHCGNHLQLIDIFSSCIEVSEMGRDYSRWCLKCKVDLNTIFSTSGPRRKRFAFLFVTPDDIEADEESSSSLLIHIPGKIISYNLKRNTFKSFQLVPRRDTYDNFLRVEQPNF